MSEINKKRILVVDDEPNIHKAIQRELNTPPFNFFDYAVEGFIDPLLALRRASETTFDAVISDYRMPSMDGVEFLHAFALIQPDCMRIVLSGQTDMDALTCMINESHIYHFIPKPWRASYLKCVLAQALDYGAVLLENKRLAKLAEARHLEWPRNEADAIDHVLIVSDDMSVLNSLSWVRNSQSDGDDPDVKYRANQISIQVTPSTQYALAHASSINFAAIIADLRMPEMNGIELLTQFSLVQPECSRILITRNIDQEELVHAVNLARIFAFIEKPWSDNALKTTLLLAISRSRMLVENRRLSALVS